MNELNRIEYLQAMGVDSYVSRRPLPGAAVSKRLVIVRKARSTESVGAAVENPANVTSAAATTTATANKASMPALDGLLEAPVSPAQSAESAADVEKVASVVPPTSTAVQFSLAVIFVGAVAWVEDLQGRPLAKEQVQLIQAMARALGSELERPQVTQFDWPVHHNKQLDQGLDAANAAVSGFLQRQMAQFQCRGIVLLGEQASLYVPTDTMAVQCVVKTHGSMDMLQNQGLKPQVWSDLQPLVVLGRQ